MAQSRKRVRPNRPVEQAALRAVQAVFEDANQIFQPVLGGNDIGKDAYVDIVDDNEVTGDVIAVQIKGGESYRRSNGYVIPCKDADRELWRSSSIPVFGIVHDAGRMHWTNLTAWARALSNDSRPAAAPVDPSFIFDGQRLSSFLAEARSFLSASGPPALIDLASDDPSRQRAAIVDSFGLARNDARPLLLLRASLRYMRDPDVCALAIHALTLTVGHGDIFWTPSNWLPDSVRKTVRREFRWSPDEAEQLIAAAASEEWCRGGRGQDVHALLDADPNMIAVINRVFVQTQNDDVAYRCLLILIDAAGDRGLAEWARLTSLRRDLADQDLVLELRRLLGECQFFTLW